MHFGQEWVNHRGTQWHPFYRRKSPLWQLPGLFARGKFR
jgi:hypothetical protein